MYRPGRSGVNTPGRHTSIVLRGNEAHGTTIAIRQVCYLQNMVEQDHRAVKSLTRPMLGFKSFDAASCTLTGVELMQMIRKDQLVSGAEQVYALAA